MLSIDLQVLKHQLALLVLHSVLCGAFLELGEGHVVNGVEDLVLAA